MRPLRPSLALAAPLVAAALALAGCASAGSQTAATGAAPSSAPSAAAASSSPSCLQQGRDWAQNGGQREINAVVTDLGTVHDTALALSSAADGAGDLSSAEAGLQSAAASLQSDAQAAEADPAPSCIPHMRADESQAMTLYAKAAADLQNAVSELSSGNDGVALGDLKAGLAAQNKGTAKILKATADLKAFENSGG